MPSAWVAHVKKYYSDRRKKDPKYKYSSAMKDARASYKKADKSEPKPKGKVEEEAPEKPKRKRRRKATKAAKAGPGGPRRAQGKVQAQEEGQAQAPGRACRFHEPKLRSTCGP